MQDHINMTQLMGVRAKRAALVLVGWIAVSIPGHVSAQTATKTTEPPQPKVLVVSPAAVPVPAFKYRLLPSSADLNPGDAAPIYLRAHGYEDTALEGAWRQISEKSAQWQELPFKDFPAAEARAFVNLWSGKLKQIEFGTRRKSCDWNYTLPEERLNAVEILLPDAQSMRQWGRILALKARVEIAEGKYDDAVHTIETGLAFGRHVAAGPFLINRLIGVAIANLMLAPFEDLVAQPGAPNLYWALTALPRPLIDLRDSLEIEQKLVENLIPELTEAELARPRTGAEWSSLLSRMHEGIVKWSRVFRQNSGANSPANIPDGWDVARLKAEMLPAAREYLENSEKRPNPQIVVVFDDQTVALYLAGRYRELRDDFFKTGYLPVPDALPRIMAAEERNRTAKDGPLAFFVQSLTVISRAFMFELRLDRRIAALRVIEAVRLHAAAHAKVLPESLNQITEVPVPDDPATGNAFEYQLTGNSAVLSGPPAGLLPPWPSYRIALRQ
jgi:hypothetical protein